MKNVSVILVLLSCCGMGLPQSQAVQQGIGLFYSARFEEAAQVLQAAVLDGTLSKSELFTAHLYIAFSRIRLNAEAETVRLNFSAAVKADPAQQPDPGKTPPDLYEQFAAVRNSLVGGLLVLSDPPEASVLLMEPVAGVMVNGYTPITFSSLLQGEYELVVSKDGYLTHTETVNILAGQSDTLIVSLAQKKPLLSAAKKRWIVLGGGGLLLTTAILASIPWAGEGEEPKPTPDLPVPPNRPGRP